MPSERQAVEVFLGTPQQPISSVPQAFTLALLVVKKWDRALTGNNAATAADVAQFDNFTPREMAEFRELAKRTLEEYVNQVRPVSVVVPDSWSRGFWQGFAASWAYAVSLAGIAIIFKLFGSDLLTILKELLLKQ